MNEELSYADFSILEHALLIQADLLRIDGDAEHAHQAQLRASLMRSLSDDHEDARL